jgi:HSP20 family protein
MVNIVRWDPFKELEDITNHMQQNMDTVFNQATSSALAVPLVDVFEEDDQLVLHMHIGGLTEDEIDINVENYVLTVTGEREAKEEETNNRSYILRESSNKIFRRMALPKRADTNKIAAHLADGILRIEIPIKPEAKPKKISIKANKK